MENSSLSVCWLPENFMQPLMVASNSSTLEKALETLIEASRTSDDHSDLASKKIIPLVLQLCQNISYPSYIHLLLLTLKLLRNLCAGEINNQNLFVEHTGVGVMLTVLNSVSKSDYVMIRMGVQVLANVSLAGEVHQLSIWSQFFPLKFFEIASMRKRETFDPLCMVIYTCCDGCDGLIKELCGDKGLPVMEEIVRTASTVGFGENWVKLLLSKFCLGENQFRHLFLGLCAVGYFENSQNVPSRADIFVSEQAYLLKILSEILNERIGTIFISEDFGVYVFAILKQVVGAVKCVSRMNCGLPTGSVNVDVLGYSLFILRDICAHDGAEPSKEDGSVDIVDALLSSGLLAFVFRLLHDLGPPERIWKAMKLGEDQEGSASNSSQPCPYKGFRSDLVAVIGNCAYHRKHVQDEIRERDGILLLLQQCVTDEDNPFLREWGFWAVRNVLEGNAENQQIVAELVVQGLLIILILMDSVSEWRWIRQLDLQSL